MPGTDCTGNRENPTLGQEPPMQLCFGVGPLRPQASPMRLFRIDL
jgi:hypothetical protein